MVGCCSARACRSASMQARSGQRRQVYSPAHPARAQLGAKLIDGHGSSIDSERVVRTLLARIESSSSLNAVITTAEDAALAQARELDQLRADGVRLPGSLHGMPLVVKDNIHVAGMPNTAGTPALAGFVPSADSPVVARLRQFGAIILGKANMHELAFGITSDNARFGAVRNPVDPTLMAGGSSGGTASAIAAGLAFGGLGTDTGGSVRIPAALTGIVGLRPSMGRYEQDGVTPLSTTRDTIGPMARTVADVARIDAVAAIGQHETILPEAVSLEGLRMGVPRGYFYASLDTQTATIAERVLARITDAGVTLVEADIPQLTELSQQIGLAVVSYEAPRLLEAYLADFGTGVDMTTLQASIASPDVAGIYRFLMGEGCADEPTYNAALNSRKTLQQVYRNYFSQHRVDAIVFPTTPLPARPIEGSGQTVELNGEQVPTFPIYTRNTAPATLVGIPGLSVPAGRTPDGLPVGMELDGPDGTDRHILAIGMALERLLGDGGPLP